MITVDSLRARVRRFHDLYRGLAREAAGWTAARGNDPLHFVEREAYKVALHKAIVGLEEARVALETAIQRIDEGAAKSRGAGA